MVLDRFFLWVFTAASLCGTISILFTAPARSNLEMSMMNVI
jgi:hypothetical protein